MPDLRDYQPLLFALHRELAGQKTSTKYFQVRASGSDCFNLSIREGKITSMCFHSDLNVACLAAEKKSSWKKSEDFHHDFSFLNKWQTHFAQMMASAAASSDPRPPFAGTSAPVEIQPLTDQYDPEIAKSIPAMIFHHMFQTMAKTLERGLRIDFDTDWIHGARFWNSAPMQFAYADANAFCFCPNTEIYETFSIFHPDHPRKRRTFTTCLSRSSDLASLSPFADAIKTTADIPMLAWSPRNFERIILTPSATATLIRRLLEQASQPQCSTSQVLNPSLELLDDPSNALFQFKDLLNSNGAPIQTEHIIRDGLIQSQFRKKSPNDRTEGRFYAPVLTGASEISGSTAEEISQQLPGNILFIEKLDIIPSNDNNDRVFLPCCGVLFRNGKCLGHVVPPAEMLTKNDLLLNASPIGSTVRTGELATCSLEITHETT